MHGAVRPAALAALCLLAGCAGVGVGGGGLGAGGPTPSVTPAPVPTAETPAALAAPDRRCTAPRPPSPVSPASPVPVTDVDRPTTGETVAVDALLERHRAALSERAYTVRTGDLRATVGRNGRTFRSRLRTYFGTEVRYAVRGRLYVFVQSNAGRTISYDRSYRRSVDRPPTGAEPVADATTGLNYTVAGTRTVDGETLTVLRPSTDLPVTVGGRRAVELNSTLLVGEAGIVRRFTHVVRYDAREGTRTAATQLSISELGTARVERPRVFCAPDPGDSG